MIRRPPRSTRTDTLFPYTTLFRSALGHQRAGADQAIVADHSPVEHGRAHPDQHAIADRAAVQDRVMADRAIHPQRQRKAGVRMEHRPFLDIGAVADDDRGIVRPDDSAEPDPDRSEEHTSELQSLM